ncbi:class I adenylate-forming enzyme family protein [Mycolicibacterium sediminis]|uniref:class I adenylate-forming enzyme family protein n=1 Tax=Mycolicibacterium sediminis TaxID=1286180 RepID=UPI0013CFB3BD|nr:class I adenylate-forming enzyme family protein [Mycolicibacterium sediminis]
MTDGRPTVPVLLRDAAAVFGDHDYVVTASDRLTYADAERRSAEAARWLLARGVGKGARLGLFLPNGVDWVVWWLAASRIGALAVPISTLYTPAEISKVVRSGDIGVLVAPDRVLDVDVGDRFEAAFGDLVDQTADRIVLVDAPYLRSIVTVGASARSWATRWGGDDGVPDAVLAAVEGEVSAADLAVMIHTSGSTADPKGVLHTHGTLVRQTSTWPAAIRAVTGSDGPARILCAMPFFWVGGLLAATGALHEPVTVIVMPKLDAGSALDLIERERATGVIGWPAFTQRLRDHPSFAGRDLGSVPQLRDGPLDIAMTGVPDGHPVHRTMSETAGGFAFTEIAVVDDDGLPVPDGTVGELWIRGAGVMSGYNKRERADTFDPDGWYHTGDRVYRRAGDPRLFYVGRTSELIKAGGANVSPLEVEAVIGGFDDVVQCVVVGIDHPERGEEVCAVIVPAAPVDPSSLAARARERLSGYKVPTRWLTASHDQIPTLPSGKLDRRTVRAMVVDGVVAPLVAP